MGKAWTIWTVVLLVVTGILAICSIWYPSVRWYAVASVMLTICSACFDECKTLKEKKDDEAFNEELKRDVKEIREGVVYIKTFLQGTQWENHASRAALVSTESPTEIVTSPTSDAGVELDVAALFNLHATCKCSFQTSLSSFNALMSSVWDEAENARVNALASN
jgi:hypothetical protein